MNHHLILWNTNLRKSSQLITIFNLVPLTSWKNPRVFKVEEVPVQAWVYNWISIIIGRENIIISPWLERAESDVTSCSWIFLTVSFAMNAIDLSIFKRTVYDADIGLINFGIFGSSTASWLKLGAIHSCCFVPCSEIFGEIKVILIV